MNVTRLYLIRHGETEENRNGILVGSTDVPLNDTGRYQSLTLADALQELHIDAIFASPLQRAVETAILAFGKDARIITDSSLREFHFGQWEGLHFTEISKRYPELWKTWIHDWENTDIPEAEAFSAFTKRVLDFCTEILRNHAGKNLALVSHGGCIRALLGQYFSGSAGAGYWKFKVENATLSEVEFAGELPILTRFNYR
ncbi:MAG: histidine phosphatase family protein [Desulfobulbaceae bacterium]|nr:histidine phosphatase family protein [Desulfobulbaceae bacterium]